MIFQPGQPGHVGCALLQSVLRSTDNVPCSPSFSLGLTGCVGNCFQSTHRIWGMPGVLSHMECGALIQTGDGHFPFPCKGPSTILPSVWQWPGSSCSCRRDGSTGESRVCPAPTPVGRSSLAQPGQQGFVASVAAHSSHSCCRTGCQA